MQELLKHIKTIYPISAKAEKALLEICTEVKFHKGADVQEIGHTCTMIGVKDNTADFLQYVDRVGIMGTTKIDNDDVKTVTDYLNLSLLIIQKLQDVDDFLDESVVSFFSTYTLDRFSLKAFQAQHVVLQKRILGHVIRQLSLAPYAPPDAAIDQVCQQLMQNDFKGATIGGLYFRRAAGSMVEVKKEVRKD